ncbi:MAG: YceI family protein [Bacteriovoracaceae bacterium]|nr:YceI family protein [Bacteriovoracaceae bacterium]
MGRYFIDPVHSKIEFNVKHMMFAKVRGGLKKFSGTLDYDAQKLENSRVDILIESESIDTGDLQRDNQVKGSDFLDIKKYPTITFISKKFEGNFRQLKIKGDLTLHGVTLPVILEVEELLDEMKGHKLSAKAATKINRKDFGLSWNAALEAGGILVGDEVNISLNVQFNKV